MRLEEIRATLRKQPFQPFRLRLSTGQSYDVRHPEFAWPTRTSLFVGIVENGRDDDVPDLAVQCDLLHMVAIEPIRNGRKRGASGRRKPK